MADRPLREYQRLLVAHMLEHERCACWAGMGAGKSLATLTALDALSLIEGGPTLVLAPKRVALTTWPEEARKWGFGDVVPVIGDAATRAKALKRDAAVYATNYDNLPWLIEHLGSNWRFATVVADEATRLKNFRGGFRTHPKTGKPYFQAASGSGVRTAALGRVAWSSRVKRFYELTGTPAPQGLIDLWGQAWFLDQGQRLGRTYTAFEQRWFTTSYDGYGVEPRPGAFDEVMGLVRDLCLTIDPKDWFDLKEPIVTNVYVDLPPAARKVYRDMEREMFARIGEREAEAFNAAAKTQKCLQLANGAIYVDPVAEEDASPRAKEWREVHDVKLDALASIVAEANGAPVLVAYHFRSDLARLQRAFPQARTLDADPGTLREWNLGHIPVLLAHPQSAGHGLNLQHGGNILVYFAHQWNLEEREQILERIGPVRQAQAGFDRPVYVYNIIARDTVDEDVIARMTLKCSVQEAIKQAAKRRGN